MIWLLLYLVVQAMCLHSGRCHHYHTGHEVGAIKAIAEVMDSSCCSILYTPEKYGEDGSRIFSLSYELASDFSVDLSVTALSFSRFFRLHLRKQFVDCTSPLIIIIHEDEKTRQQFSRLSNLFQMKSYIWIVYGNASLQQWFRDAHTPFDTLIIAAREMNNHRVDLYEVYRVSPETPLRTPLYGFWDLRDGYSFHGDIIYNRRINLEGIILRTGSTQNEPLHAFKKNKEGELQLEGYFPDVWRQLEIILNFTSVHYPSVDNVTGIKEGGTWNGLIGMLLRHEIDVGLSEFIIDNQRTHVVDFTFPLIKTSYQIFFKNAGINYNWDAILRPFTSEIWLSLLAWIIAASVIRSFVHFLCCQHKIEKTARPEDLNFMNSLFFHLKTICSQGHHLIPSSLSSRILYLTAYLLTCVLAPSYSAYLISYLTFRSPKRPFDNLQSFLDDGTYKLQTNAKTSEYTYFSDAKDPVLQRIYRELMVKIPPEQFPLNTQEALDRVCKDSKLAHFGDMAVAYSYLQEIKLKKKCDIVTLSEAISTIYSSIAVRKNFPYRDVINHFLRRMEDYGLIERSLFISFPREDNLKQPQNNYVDMKDVLQTFILLAIGIMISVEILVVERIYWRWKQRSESNKMWTKINGRHIGKLRGASQKKEYKTIDLYAFHN